MSRLRRATQAELDVAVAALRNGETVAFPTETVYGLGANARHQSGRWVAHQRCEDLDDKRAPQPLHDPAVSHVPAR